MQHKKYKEAVKYFKYAYYANSYKVGDYEVEVIQNFIDLGDTYLLMKNRKKALFYYKKAFGIIYKATLSLAQPWKMVKKIGDKIVSVYKKSGDYKNACHYSELISKYEAKSLEELQANE